MDGNLERAWALHKQGRHQDAIQFAQRVLSEDLDNSSAYLVIAFSRLGLKEYAAATDAVEQAIGRAPEDSTPRYVRAVIASVRGDEKGARAAIEQAIEFEPDAASYHALHGEILFATEDKDAALAATERALALDPTHQGALNLRGRILAHLGRTDAAKQSLDQALTEDPEDPDHHAAQGWLALQRKEFDAARFHFAEALRRDPHHEWARSGLVEALKAKHLLYRPLLTYLLWASRLDSGKRWTYAIGMVIAIRLLKNFGKTHPEHAIWIAPVVIAYGVFVLTSWVGGPLFDFLLVLDPFGRRVLTRTERNVACGVVGCLALAVVAAIVGVIWNPIAIALGIALGAVALPIAAVGNTTPGWPRKVMIAYATISFATCCVAAGFFAMGAAGKDRAAVAVSIVLLLAVLSTWIGSILGSIRVKR